MRLIATVIVLSLLTCPLHAQSREAAEIVSNLAQAGAWTTLGVSVWQAADRREAAVQAGVGLGSVAVASAVTKALIRSERPCHARGVSCGREKPYANMISGHAAQGCGAVGLIAPRQRTALILTSAAFAGLTWWGRHRAWKHTTGALAAGCGVGIGLGWASTHIHLRH